MNRFARLLIPLGSCILLAPTLHTQENRFHAELRTEAQKLGDCKQIPQQLSKAGGCLETLFTGQPFHIAVGSIAPQNGFGGGLAFVDHWHPSSSRWRASFNADAIATGNDSWRAGFYTKGYRLPEGLEVKLAPVLNLYAEGTSLNTIYFYGLGSNSLPAAQAAFGLTQTIAGTSAVIPLNTPRLDKAYITLYAEFNGRVPLLRGNRSTPAPSIEQTYTEATAPGISQRPAFIEPAEGIRVQAKILDDHLRLHYYLQFQNFIAPSNSRYSFRRWTADFGHEFPLDRKVYLTAANDANGPDSCSPDSNNDCPSPVHVSRAQNHEGSIGIRLLMSGSAAAAQHAVPFYFDPTIGGSDLNNQPLLPSYPDYRFRAPNLLLLRGTIEHAIPKVPLGAYFSVDEAKVGMRRDDIDFSHLRHSYSAGLTVHAGGLPVVYLLFAWGGNEGSHTIFSVSNVLLGGSARPSLF